MNSRPKYRPVPTVEMNQMQYLSPVLRRDNSIDEYSEYAPSTMTVSSRQNSSSTLNTCVIHDKRRHNRRQERLNTELLTAVMKGDFNDVKRLLDSGASPEATCRPQRISACHVAAFKGHLDILGQLLTNGASGEERDKWGRQPVHLAAWAGHRDVLDLLSVFKHDNVDSPVRVDPDPPPIEMDIVDAWNHNHDEFSHMVDEEFPEGSTALHLASKKVNKSCVDFLLRVDASVNCRDINGLTPLDVAGTARESAAPPPPPQAAAAPVPAGEPTADDLTFRIGLRSKTGLDSDGPIPSRKRNAAPVGIRISGDFPPSPKPSAPPIPTAEECKSAHDVINALLEKGAKLPQANVIYKEGSVVNQSQMNVTTLHTAVASQDLELIGILLEKNACMMTWDKNGRTALHLAVELQLIEPLKRMLTWEVQWPVVDVRDIAGRTPLHLAIIQEWADGVSLLLEVGADVKTTTNDVETVLHLAAERGNYDMLQELMSIPDSIKMMEYRNKNYFTPLGQAVDKNHLPCVELLCENGADTTNGLPGDFTLVHIAASNDSPEIIRYLLSDNEVAYKLMNIRSRPEKGGMTALHLASKRGHTDCVRELLRAGCDFLITTSEEPENSSTALHLSAKAGYLDTVETLLEFDRNKAALEAKDGQEWYPLHVSAMNGHGPCVKAMLLHGADIAATVPHETGFRTGLDIINYCVPQSIDFLVDIFNAYIIPNKRPITDPECEIEVKYDILIPQGTSKKQMKVLNALLNTGSRKLQERLLLHPIVETFLFLKWRRLRVYYITLVTFFVLFTLSLTALSLLHYVIKDKQHFAYICGLMVSRALLTWSFIPIVLAEFINVLQLQKYYLRDYETIVKWIVFVGSWTVGVMDPGGDWARHVASVTVLLAWIELLFLLARFPSWGFYALMFSKVAKNVVKVLGTFAFIMFGFTFAFMINHKTEEPFKEFWESFVTVVVMMIEPNYADSLNPDVLSPWSLAVGRGLYLIFVILIAIVLMNLLVGLAVSDIGALEAQGRTERLAKQVAFLSLLEVFVYNDWVLRCLCGCLRYRVERRRCVETSVTIRPATPLKSNVFQQLPRAIRESILEKVTDQQSYADGVSTSLQNLDTKINQLVNNASQVPRKSFSTENDELDSIKLVLAEIMKQLSEVRNEVNAHRTNSDLQTDSRLFYQRPDETIISI